MKNQYVGDIGDYGKIGMLRVLQCEGFALGVNWYLTPDDNTSDGRHIEYLDKPCDVPDRDLYLALKEIIKTGRRKIAALESDRVLKDAVFFNEVLDFSKCTTINERCNVRRGWHDQARDCLKTRDLVFLDPDNGLEVKSVKPHYLRGNKYTTYQEVCDYFHDGASVIIYNHRDRSPEEKYLKRLGAFHKMDQTAAAQLLCLRFSKVSVRDYLFLIHDKHFDRIKQVLDLMLASDWECYFSYQNIQFK